MPRQQQKLSGAAVILLNDYQQKAIEHGVAGERGDYAGENSKAEMLKARYRLENYIKMLAKLAGKHIAAKKAHEKATRKTYE
jgi:hypothetical protein